IKYSNPNASDEEMYYAAKMSNLNSYIEKLPKKYQTFLKQAGAGLSHGQRQLLAIARAVLANPKILILDEATSSVDTRTEKNIQDAMVPMEANENILFLYIFLTQEQYIVYRLLRNRDSISIHL
ncbi:MAG: ATP-binding cassette domain-containing protein, partial [Agathobacter sp.]|nr:ATP-binding cassette domain-containing protein [Agathobacter sp.]